MSSNTIPEGTLSLHDDDLCIMHKGEIRFLLRLEFEALGLSLALPLDNRRFLLSRALASYNRSLVASPSTTRELKSLFSGLLALTLRVDELEAQAQKGQP